MRDVAVLATGGTISCTVDASGAAVPTLGAVDLVATFAPATGIRVDPVDSARFASWSVDPPRMLTLSREVDALLAGHDGVVVTHGTDTIEETAAFLDLTVRSDRPVVVTGAMRNASLPGYDGPRNLWGAVRVAADRSAATRGCLVALNDEIHLAREVTKSHSTNTATFTSPWRGPVGAVDEGGVRFWRPAGARPRYDVVDASARVPLIWLAAGMDDGLLRAAAAIADGLVVAAAGIGHLPAGWMHALRAAVAAGLPVVVTTRTGAGPVTTGVYGGAGGDIDVAAAGVIPGGDRRPLQARLELICALGAGLTGDDLRAAFTRY